MGVFTTKNRLKYNRERQKKFRLTFKGWLISTLNNMKKSCIKRNHPLPKFTKKELGIWLNKNYPQETEDLFESWRNSGYLKEMRPSIDRINDSKSYDFSNINITNWKTNKRKGDTARRVPIKKISLNGSLVDIHTSIKHAAKSVNKFPSGISSVLDQPNLTYMGFKWKRLYTN